MVSLSRDICKAANEQHDVIIVGGGIYGAMMMLEASKAGLKALLLESSDFGGSTSFNNLRIVHGGLRYLQSMHLSRFAESVRERQWFLKTFPDLVAPIDCLMPLYGQFPKNNTTLRMALALNDLLSRKRNEGVAPSHHLLNGRLLTAAETRKRFPHVRTQGLTGGALWFDAVMPDCHRILIETLRWSVAAQGTALNYVTAKELLSSNGKVAGVVATDEITREKIEFRADVVINTAGPKSMALARQFDSHTPDFYRPSVAWNLLLDRESLSAGAVALQAPGAGSQVYFAHSLNGKLLLGTGHRAAGNSDDQTITSQQIGKMLADLNSAVPGIDVRETDVMHIFSGQLSVKKANGIELSDEPAIVDHQAEGGPRGLYSVGGIKFTTARATAESLVSRISRNTNRRAPSSTVFPGRPKTAPYQLDNVTLSDEQTRQRIDHLIANEAPRYLDDLFYRRSNLILDPLRAEALARKLDLPLAWKPATPE